MDRNQETLALINQVKEQFSSKIEKQREINKSIDNILNEYKENKVKVICEGGCLICLQKIKIDYRY